MVSGPSFYIYGGGRWREVDISNGSIEGWGRAGFVYAKRGKIHVAKSRSVITALRNLKDGKRSAVRDGARLLTERNEQVDADKYVCTHGYQQTNYNGNLSSKLPVKPIREAQPVSKADIAIQTTILSPKSFPTSKRGKSSSTSSDENVPSKIITTAMVNSSPKHLAKLRLKKQWSLAGSEKVSPKKKVPSLKLHKEDSTKYNLYKCNRSNSTDSLVWVVLPKNGDGNKTKQMYNSKEYVKANCKQMKRRRLSSSSSSQESQPQKIAKRNLSQIFGKTKTVADIALQSPNNVKKSQSAPNRAIKSHHKNKKVEKAIVTHDQSSYDVEDKFKELIIEETDVEVLRKYLMNSSTDFDLLKFDQDDEYKKQFFYTINPLVNVERCSKIARMHREDSQSEMSLKDFASQLGLASVSETKAPQRYKMRNRILYKDTDKSDFETDREDMKDIKNTVNKRTGDQTKQKTLKTRSENKTSSKKLDSEILIESSSSNETSEEQGDVDHTPNSYKTRQSVRNNTDINGTYNKTGRSDQYLIEEKRARVLRKRRHNRDLNSNRTLSSDSEEYIKKSNKVTQNKTMNGNKNNVKDITKLNDEDPDFRIQESNPNAGTDTSSNSDVELVNKEIKKELNINNKRFTKQSNSNVKDVIKTAISKSLKHTRKATLINSNSMKKKIASKFETTSESESENETITKRRNEIDIIKNYRKNNTAGINDGNSDAEEHRETRSRQNNETSNSPKKSLNQLPHNSKVDKSSKDKRSNKHNDSMPRSLNSASSKVAKPVISNVKSLADAAKKIKSNSANWVASLYSNLEDHAIVSWVSLGGRAQSVNGNRIWRELQDQYYSIAGQKRSWHSLRNRYLRHILPRLGQLALDPSLVGRLRAAAATGEIKSRGSSRRNSIFGEPARGALSRRPRPQRSPISDEEHPPKRTKHDHKRQRQNRHGIPSDWNRMPRYSDITRHFAAKHRGSTPLSSSDPHESPRKVSQEAKHPANTSKHRGKTSETKTSETKTSETRKSDRNTMEKAKLKSAVARSVSRLFAEKNPSATSEESNSRVARGSNSYMTSKEGNNSRVTRRTNSPVTSKESNNSRVTRRTNSPVTLKESNNSRVTRRTNSPVTSKESNNTSRVTRSTNSPVTFKETNPSRITRSTNSPVISKETNTSRVSRAFNFSLTSKETNNSLKATSMIESSNVTEDPTEVRRKSLRNKSPERRTNSRPGPLSRTRKLFNPSSMLN